MTKSEFVNVPANLKDRAILDERSKSLSIAASREIESWSIAGKVEFSDSSYEAAVKGSEDKTLPPAGAGPVSWGGG